MFCSKHFSIYRVFNEVHVNLCSWQTVQRDICNYNRRTPSLMRHAVSPAIEHHSAAVVFIRKERRSSYSIRQSLSLRSCDRSGLTHAAASTHWEICAADLCKSATWLCRSPLYRTMKAFSSTRGSFKQFLDFRSEGKLLKVEEPEFQRMCKLMLFHLQDWKGVPEFSKCFHFDFDYLICLEK
jgi:hypothetical protein